MKPGLALLALLLLTSLSVEFQIILQLALQSVSQLASVENLLRGFQGWSLEVQGVPMFRLSKKLKAVKQVLKQANVEVFGGIFLKVSQARERLALAHNAFMQSHGDAALLLQER